MKAFDKFRKWSESVNAYKPENLDQLQQEYKEIFKDSAIPFCWHPSESQLKESNIALTMQEKGFTAYSDFFNWSVANRSAFWDYTIKKLGIKFSKGPTSILQKDFNIENPEWLKGAEMNIAESCFSASKEKIAILEGKEGTDKVKSITYGEMEHLADKFGSGLLKSGFNIGDKIIFYLPFTSEAVIAYLGAIKAGLVVVSVADSFSPEELKKRAEITKSKAVLTCDGYLYGGKWLNIYDKVKISEVSPAIVIQYGHKITTGPGDLSFTDILAKGDTLKTYYSDPQTVTNILFSSGTTKEPKAIPWTNITPLKCGSDGYYHHDIKGKDIVTWTTGMGWMMAPWLIFAAFLNKATMALYNGAASGEGFGKFAENTGITILGTIPSVVKAWKKQEFHLKHDWKVRLFSSTGEPSNTVEYFYLMALGKFKAPIIEYCGGTEIGGGYITGTVVQPSSPATFTTPALGLDFYLLNEKAQPSSLGEPGEVYIVPPSIGLTQTLLNKDHHAEYYEGAPKGPKGEVLRRHGDAFEKVEQDGFIFYRSVGRTDDAMNLGGIKVSAVEIEEVLNHHPAIFETAAVSVPTKGGGPEKLVIFYVKKGEPNDLTDPHKELQALITTKLNPLFRIAEVRELDLLPRTASNKVMRRELRKGV